MTGRTAAAAAGRRRGSNMDMVSTALTIASWTATVAAGLGVFCVQPTDSTCSDDQRSTCLNAVSTRENWSSLLSSGECIVKQYVYFTHICTVSNYLPNVDYCCCVNDVGLLCCRYHQGHNHFRCMEADDLVDTLGTSRDYSPPLEVLLPSVLVPSALLLLCVLCCVRKCCCFGCHGDDDAKPATDDNGRTGCCHRCYENMCGYELAMDVDEFQPVPGGLHRCSHCLQYSDKHLTETPSTVCTTDGHGLPYSTEPSCCYTTHWMDRPPTMPTTSHALMRPTSAYCPDCTAARFSRIHPVPGDWPPVEPSAPPLMAATEAPDPGDVDVDATGSTEFGLARRPSSPPVVTARCYRYIASSTSSYRQGRSSFSGRSTRSYFRSLIPGGDAAFPVPPPAYDDS